MQIKENSYSEINRTYFFTATIHQWLPLLAAKENKELFIVYLKELSVRGMIKNLWICYYALSPRPCLSSRPCSEAGHGRFMQEKIVNLEDGS